MCGASPGLYEADVCKHNKAYIERAVRIHMWNCAESAARQLQLDLSCSYDYSASSVSTRSLTATVARKRAINMYKPPSFR